LGISQSAALAEMISAPSAEATELATTAARRLRAVNPVDLLTERLSRKLPVRGGVCRLAKNKVRGFLPSSVLVAANHHGFQSGRGLFVRW
jgi:hypothetical protein